MHNRQSWRWLDNTNGRFFRQASEKAWRKRQKPPSFLLLLNTCKIFRHSYGELWLCRFVIFLADLTKIRIEALHQYRRIEDIVWWEKCSQCNFFVSSIPLFFCSFFLRHFFPMRSSFLSSPKDFISALLNIFLSAKICILHISILSMQYCYHWFITFYFFNSSWERCVSTL